MKLNTIVATTVAFCNAISDEGNSLRYLRAPVSLTGEKSSPLAMNASSIQLKIASSFDEHSTALLRGTGKITRNAQSWQKQFNIVHIGDSYSPGNGVGYGFHGPKGCLRSNFNWGELYAYDDSIELNSAFPRYFNRACSGMHPEHYFNDRFMNKVTNLPGGECPAPVMDEKFIKDQNGDCQRFMRAGKHSITENTDLVLMTLGGNLPKWPDVVTWCFTVQLEISMCKNALDYADKQINGDPNNGKSIGKFQEEMVKVLEDIVNNRLRHGAKLIWFPYPHLLWDEKFVIYGIKTIIPGILWYPWFLDVKTQARKLRDDLEEQQRIVINTVLQKLVWTGEPPIILFDEIASIFDGHEPNPSLPFVNEDRWINEYLEPGADSRDWYHPNREGHQEWAKALVKHDSFGVIPQGTGTSTAHIDMALILDATISMEDTIAQVKEHLSGLVDGLSSLSASYRVAIVTYQDFPDNARMLVNEYPGGYADYPSKVELDFTDKTDVIQAAIDAITVSGGGDWPETVLSGINAALELNWRNGATKIAIVIGDARAKIINGQEPNSGLTPEQIIAKSIAIDPVAISAVNIGGDLALPGSPVASIVDTTGGSVEDGVVDIIATLEGILVVTSQKPLAWFGESIVGKIGEPITFDARGSFDPSGADITSFEWDFDGNGNFGVSTDNAIIQHTFDTAFGGYSVLRVTSVGGVSLASAHVVVNEEGSVSQFVDEYCEVDENGMPIYEDKDGNNLLCEVQSWPENPVTDVGVITDDDIQMNVLSEINDMFSKIEEAIEDNDNATACNTLASLIKLARDEYENKAPQLYSIIIDANEIIHESIDCSSKGKSRKSQKSLSKGKSSKGSQDDSSSDVDCQTITKAKTCTSKKMTGSRCYWDSEKKICTDTGSMDCSTFNTKKVCTSKKLKRRCHWDKNIESCGDAGNMYTVKRRRKKRGGKSVLGVRTLTLSP